MNDYKEKFQFRVVYYDNDGHIIKSQIQEVPLDNKYHRSKVVKEEEIE